MDVQKQLDEGQALIEILETEDAVFNIYLDRDTVIAYSVDTVVRLEAATFQNLVQDPESDLLTIRSTGAALYDRIFGPVASFLEKRKHLIVSPSSSLQALPMAALTRINRNGSRYLIEQHTIRYIDSWRTERLNAQRRTVLASHPIRKAGIWTHPDLINYLGSLANDLLTFHGLAGTHFTTSNITRSGFLRSASDFDLLQLSLHAKGNSSKLNENYLYLSNQDSINGIEVAALSLNCRLVALAACSTGRGLNRRREGTYSMRRSFHLAGVPDVVSSQFDIPARTTQLLMSQFYNHLIENKRPEEALALTQRQFIQPEGKNYRWRHPFYWAGLNVN